MYHALYKKHPKRKFLLTTVFGSIIVAIALTGLSQLTEFSNAPHPAGYASSMPFRLTLKQHTFVLSAKTYDTRAVGSLQLKNLQSVSINVHITTSCECVLTHPIDVEIEPYETAELTVFYKPENTSFAGILDISIQATDDKTAFSIKEKIDLTIIRDMP
jgi:hypothetical protein